MQRDLQMFHVERASAGGSWKRLIVSRETMPYDTKSAKICHVPRETCTEPLFLGVDLAVFIKKLAANYCKTAQIVLYYKT